MALPNCYLRFSKFWIFLFGIDCLVLQIQCKVVLYLILWGWYGLFLHLYKRCHVRWNKLACHYLSCSQPCSVTLCFVIPRCECAICLTFQERACLWMCPQMLASRHFHVLVIAYQHKMSRHEKHQKLRMIILGKDIFIKRSTIRFLAYLHHLDIPLYSILAVPSLHLPPWPLPRRPLPFIPTSTSARHHHCLRYNSRSRRITAGLRRRGALSALCVRH